MEAFLVSTGVVALAEMGDKTQLLAFILAARFKKPLPIVAGILCATVCNHALAGVLLTHFHSDHITDLGEFNLQTWGAGRPGPLQVFGPEGIERLVADLKGLKD